MPKGRKAPKPEYNFINPECINDQVIERVKYYLHSMGYDETNPKDRKTLTHNELNYIFKMVYADLFKPEKPLYNNQKSLLNYDDINTIKALADTFVNICSLLNKSLGLMSFSYLIGVSYTTLINWMKAEKSNPERFRIVKYIQEAHKLAQIGLLNDTPVGALAVANNDKETGLNWSANQAAQITNNTVYLLPSERVDRFRLEDHQETPT